jgi:signal transduction histidine kinase
MTTDLATEELGHILIVDDYPLNRLKLDRVLRQQGHTTAQAENGQQALSMLRAESFDVVLLDIIMPEMDGHQVLTEMKRDHTLRDIPVIVISAVEEVDAAAQCIELGAEDYLSKPFNPIFLKARLRASLRRKKLRDLEQAYLQQELTLRQSEKLATLGRLSAGMAHELNNPAGAVQRGAAQLRTAFIRHLEAHLVLDEAGLSPAQIAHLRQLAEQVRGCARQPLELNALARSDREAELEDWLEDQAVPNGWELVADLVSLGYDAAEMDKLAADFPAGHLPPLLTWLINCFTLASVLSEIGEGAERMSEIVKALKVYTYLDQAPVQNVNIHEGLDNTLIMLRGKLKQGVTVERRYAADLPLIEAYGSELNQVWTNIIDNAIAAMQGQGQITLTTHRDSAWVLVEITDTGSGIPAAIQPQIFDPFFTTKPPGEGTGLGLNISHSIIVQKHRGQITVVSEPGQTCFQVRLPLTLSG